MDGSKRIPFRWWMVGGMLGLLLLGAALSRVEASPPGGPGEMRGQAVGLLSAEDREAIAERIGKRIQERLGLTAEQWGTIQATLKATREQTRTDRTALRQAHGELKALLGDSAADPGALQAAADRVKALQGALIDRRIETTLALRGVLTAEQWEKWQSLRRDRGGHGRRHIR